MPEKSDREFEMIETRLDHSNENHTIDRLKKKVIQLSLPFQNYKELQSRKIFEESLKILQSLSDQSFSGRVLVDAGWDNPNYWLRYSILWAALNFSRKSQIGYIGPFRRKQQIQTLRNFGIEKYYDVLIDKGHKKDNLKFAESICAGIKSQGDILELQLPFEMPGTFLYDYILKRQRSAVINVDSPSLKQDVLFFLNSISAANSSLSQVEPSLLISSHAISWFSALVWVALKKGIRTIIPYGDNRCLKFWNIFHVSEIYDITDSLKKGELSNLSDSKIRSLERIGSLALNQRILGQNNNLAAIYAYRMRKEKTNKKAICSYFQWDCRKKIIGIYASNWFDFPHTIGMKHFENFYDWMSATIEKIKETKDVNWILKAHPCDDWYRGLTLGDLINVDTFSHIRIAPKDWNGADMLNSLDGFITYHGTVGIEATAMKKPVLVADQGWYDDWHFVKVPESREDYLSLLTTDWWKEMDVEENSRLAKIFAGAYWGIPSWQKEWQLSDDSEQWNIYKTGPSLIDNNRDVIHKEIQMVQQWYDSGHPHYHTYKMIQSDSYFV